MSSNWRNRIVGTAEVDPKILIPNALNFKKHPEFQKRLMDSNLVEIGWLQHVIVSKRSGKIIDGHMRVLLACEKGEPTVPVSFVDLDEDEEIKALATLDPIGEFAEKDASLVKSLIEKISFSNVALSDMIMKIAQSSGAMKVPEIPGVTQPSEPKGDTTKIDKEQREYYDNAKQNFPVSYGDIWKIGKHSVVCIDCTSESGLSYIREVAPKQKISINTDPPYGIDAVGPDGRIGYGAKFGDIEGDKKPFDPRFMLDLSDNLVLWGANHYSNLLPSSPCWFVWDKREGDRHNDQADCELAWCSPNGVVRIFHHIWMGFARASERGSQRLHATQKPVALIAWSITEKVPDSGIVLDPYLGSGTTLLACEQTNRLCIGMEIIPDIASVAIMRFYEATQIKPRRIGKI